MLRIKRIVSYICMFQVIFQHFGTLAATVSINQNITGLVGNKDTYLTCSFYLEKGEEIFSVQINAKNITEDFDDNKLIAIFKPEKASRLLTSGKYLSERVTLTNITNISTNATLLFNVLKCTDEKDYMCTFFYYDMVKVIRKLNSKATRLTVKVQTRHVNVNKQPNQKQYGRKTDQINLTCSAIGNPEPEYIWFKQDNRRNILSRINTYTIGDVNPNTSGIYICEAFNIINNVIYRNSYSVAIDIADKLLQITEPESMPIFAVHAAYAISFICIVVVVVLCFAIRKKYCNREKRNIHSEVSDDQEQISVDNEYEEIESVSYHEVILHNDRIETSNPPTTEEEIVLESITISTCTNSSESNTTSSYSYVNTDIFNTNGNRKVSANHETISDQPNGLGSCQIGVDNTFVRENSGSDTLHFNQYVNTTSLRVPNFYEDLNHTTVDTHKYESPHKEGVTTFTE